VSTRLGRPRPSTLWITGPCNDLLGGGGMIEGDFWVEMCMTLFRGGRVGGQPPCVQFVTNSDNDCERLLLSGKREFEVRRPDA